jgi:hypothetical protein
LVELTFIVPDIKRVITSIIIKYFLFIYYLPNMFIMGNP